MRILFQCLGITGLIFVFYGLLALAVTQAQGNAFFRFLMGSGILFLLIFIVNWFRQASKNPAIIRELFQSRTAKSGAGAVVYSLIVLMIISVVNVYSSKRFNFQKDLTAEKVHTLSDQTVKKLKSLTTPLNIIAFLDERNQGKGVLKELLKKYSDESKQVDVKFIDPDKNKLTAEKFSVQDGDIVIEYQGQSHITKDISEQAITQAILKVGRSESSVLCFTTGHGELEIGAKDDDPRSLSAIKLGLENEGFESRSLESLSNGVEDGCSILVIAGPTQKFTEAEASSVDQYLSRGGKAIFMLDPNVPDPRLSQGVLSVLETGLEQVAEKWGVSLGKNLVLEKQVQLFSGVQIVPTVRALQYGNHPIVEPMKKGSGLSTVFDRVRSVEVSSSFEGTAVELAFSVAGENSWGQSNVDALFRERKAVIGPNDPKGPVSLAVAAEKNLDGDEVNKKTQLVVFGDSDFASNALVRSYEFNFDLILNALNWLSGEREQISIRAKKLQSSAIELTPKQANTIFYVAIITIPMLVLTFGLNLWWYRRRTG